MTLYTIVVAVRRGPVPPDAAIPGREFLLVQNARRNGRWELPGGRGRRGETPLACARREFHEETGRAFHRPRLVGRRNSELGDGYVFLVDPSEPRVPAEAAIVAQRFVARLPPAGELSFPNDPYAELFALVARRLAHRHEIGRGVETRFF